MHGVSLSIGGTDPLDLRVPRRAEGARATARGRVWVSDHLCWTGVAATQHARSAARCRTPRRRCGTRVARVRQVQEISSAPLLLENPSTYLEFAGIGDDGVGFPRRARRAKPTAAFCST